MISNITWRHNQISGWMMTFLKTWTASWSTKSTRRWKSALKNRGVALRDSSAGFSEHTTTTSSYHWAFSTSTMGWKSCCSLPSWTSLRTSTAWSRLRHSYWCPSWCSRGRPSFSMESYQTLSQSANRANAATLSWWGWSKERAPVRYLSYWTRALVR